MGNIIGNDPEPADRPWRLRLDCRDDIDDIAVGKPKQGDVIDIHEQNLPRSFHPAKTVAIAVDGRVELVVGSQRRQVQDVRTRRLRREFGRGGTEIGVARARDLKNRVHLSPGTIKRMVSFFARHEIDKRAKNFGNEENPSAGYVAWLLWGGDEGRAWAIAMKEKTGNAPDI